MGEQAARVWHATIATVLVVALLLQLWIAVQVSPTPPAHAVGTLAGAPVGNRIVRVFSFFTIQSNVLCCVTSARLALSPAHDGRLWRTARLASLFGITLTGLVYVTVLARTHDPNGWMEAFTNGVFHYIVPVMMVLGWLLFGPRPRIDGRTIAVAFGWPVAWVVYTLIHGAVTKWYPYPFTDVPTHGYAVVLFNSVLVVVVLLLVTALFWLGDRRLPSRPSSPRLSPGGVNRHPSKQITN